MKKDNKKINKTRRNRGYAFESEIVKKFKINDNWNAMRLGGASNNLPDIMCINNWGRSIIAVEAKSVHSDLAYIPEDQIERCKNWVKNFDIYHRHVVLMAFKFGQTNERKLKVFYKIFPDGIESGQVRCRPTGVTSIKQNGKWSKLECEEFKI